MARDGKVYYATANEGDPRNEDWGWYGEQKISTLRPRSRRLPGEGDPGRRDDMLGRLQVTTTLGDADGDGAVREPVRVRRALFLHLGRERQAGIRQRQRLRAHHRQPLRYLFRLADQGVPARRGMRPGRGRSRRRYPSASSACRRRRRPASRADRGPTYGFIGAEKISGWWVYDVTNPARSEFVTYFSNRHPDIDPTLDVDADLSARRVASSSRRRTAPRASRC